MLPNLIIIQYILHNPPVYILYYYFSSLTLSVLVWSCMYSHCMSLFACCRDSDCCRKPRPVRPLALRTQRCLSLERQHSNMFLPTLVHRAAAQLSTWMHQQCWVSRTPGMSEWEVPWSVSWILWPPYHVCRYQTLPSLFLPWRLHWWSI